MALWTAVMPVQLTLTEETGGASTVETPAVPVHFQAAAANFHGLYDPAVAQIFINRELGGAPLAIAVAHEVGHAFGLAHVSASERPSIMNPGNLTVEPNAADADTLISAWGDCRGTLGLGLALVPRPSVMSTTGGRGFCARARREEGAWPSHVTDEQRSHREDKLDASITHRTRP